MIRRSRLARRASLTGLAASGLAAGHALGYVIAVPDAHRSEVLARTGHGYLGAAAWIAGALVVACALGALRTGALARSGAFGLRRAMIATAVAQAAAFVALETAERALAGVGLDGLGGPLLWVGIGVQLAFGAVVAALHRTLVCIGERLGRSSVRRVPRAPRSLISTSRAVPPRWRAFDAHLCRGPPLPRATA